MSYPTQRNFLCHPNSEMLPWRILRTLRDCFQEGRVVCLASLSGCGQQLGQGATRERIWEFRTDLFYNFCVGQKFWLNSSSSIICISCMYGIFTCMTGLFLWYMNVSKYTIHGFCGFEQVYTVHVCSCWTFRLPKRLQLVTSEAYSIIRMVELNMWIVSGGFQRNIASSCQTNKT